MGKGLSLPLVLVLLLAACTGLFPNRPTGNFKLEINPSHLSVTQGGSQTTTLSLTPQNGFKGQVVLLLENQDGTPLPSGITFSPSSLNVTGSNPVTQALRVQVAPEVATGTYSLRLKATSGAISQTANLRLTVTAPPDFTLSLNPTSLSVQQGSSGTTQLTLIPQNGFYGTVSLALVNAPTGVSLSPGNVGITGPSPVTQTLTLTTSPSTPTGTYALKVRATGGGLSREASLSLTVTQAPVGDFTLTLEGSSLTVAQGSSAYVRLAVNGSYPGSISLSLVDEDRNPFPGVSLSPTSTPVPSAPMLEVAASPSVAPGTYNLWVQGKGGDLVREASLTLTVTSATPAPDFTLSLNPTSLSVQQGSSGTTQLTLTPQNGFSGQVNLTVSGAPSGVSVTFQQNPWNIPQGNNPQSQTVMVNVGSNALMGQHTLTLTATSGSLTRTAPLTLTVTTLNQANLYIAKAEWGQTVLKEGLRLVAGKPALLRVHLLASPSPIPLGTPLAGGVYQGSTFQGNLTFTCPNPIPTATDPGNLATTCTATLPESWMVPGLRVELRADPQDQVTESNESDNRLTLTPSVGTGTVLYLTVVPVVHQGQQAQVPSFSQTLWRIWPLKEISPTTRAPYTFSGTLSANDGNTWAQLLDELRILRQADGSGRYYYGFVKVTYTSGIAGIGYIGHPVAVGWDYAQSGPAVMAHELGHNFGREHAPCGTSGDANYPYPGGKIGTWGYDLANKSLKDPSQHYDLMSYCGPQWISDYTYGGAQSFLETSPPKPLSLPEEGLLFSGRIGNGEVVLRPPLRIAAWPEGDASPYRLQAKTASGEVQEAPVLALRDSEGILHFQARLPLEAYTRAGLYLGDQLLKETTLPLLPQAEPQVELREEGGFLWARVQGYPYFSLFHLAPDGTRTALGLWHRAGEVGFALANLPPGGEFEVQLSDGLNVRILRFPR